MATLSISNQELEALSIAVQARFDYINDTLLDDVHVADGTQMSANRLSIIRDQLSNNVDHLITLVRLQEKLKQVGG